MIILAACLSRVMRGVVESGGVLGSELESSVGAGNVQSRSLWSHEVCGPIGLFRNRFENHNKAF